ncbi:MAG: tRNA(Ile)-lysidine synthase [Candidatus Electronema aureum]|uniref:tRNA(Ile)-lysidine synthase n=1 Tax=Candidatus Electronema aureum TaxID=2005002 RepID=A0A521FZG5_9BACT|nr:MAG: tRNA(Ile)-lysidine synthase [Candidatus Electronema aureum]
MTKQLENHFLRMLTGSCGINEHAGIVAAVSGGPDSMALLHLLASARKILRLELVAVWVDHGLRPTETPQEKETVAAATEKLGIPFLPKTADVTAYAQEKHLSIEHAARELRYAILREVAKNCSASAIAVGHTADDQAEEVLIRLLRGSGRKGLAGMSMKSGEIIRPLLRTNKQDLLAWLTQRDIPHCFDSSNNDRKFLRNRVRHELLPFLCEQFEPGIKNSLLKTADSLAVDEDLLEEMTTDAWQQVVQEEDDTLRLLREPFRVLHPALQRRTIEQLLWRMGSKAKYDHILLIIEATLNGRNRSELHLSSGLRVGVFVGWLEFSYPAGHRAWRGRLLEATPAPSVAPLAPAHRQTQG